MLTIESALRELRALPILVQLGLVAVLGGGLADVFAHLSTQAAEHSPGFTPAESLAHVVVIVGMSVVLLGVLIDAGRPHPDRPVGDSTKGGE